MFAPVTPAGMSIHPSAGELAAAAGEDVGGSRSVLPTESALAKEKDWRSAQQHSGHL